MTAARGLHPRFVGIVRTRIGGETQTGFPHLGSPKFVGKMRAIGDRCASFALGVERSSSSSVFCPLKQRVQCHIVRDRIHRNIEAKNDLAVQPIVVDPPCCGRQGAPSRTERRFNGSEIENQLDRSLAVRVIMSHVVRVRNA